jgi:DNA-binding CsgD family transcriptional regulator
MTIVLAEQLPVLIGEIYDAAIDTTRWSAVLGSAARFIGGSSAVLLSKGGFGRHAQVEHDSGTDPDYLKLYSDKYVEFDPANACPVPIEQPVAVDDLMPYHAYKQTRFYREWVQPQGVVDYVATVLDRSAGHSAVFNVFRHERDGLVDDEARRRMRLVTPHIRRAMLVGRMVDLKTSAAAKFAETLGGLRTGVCLVDAGGRIVHANAACRAILDAGDFLSGATGRMVARDGKINRKLRELFAAVAAGDVVAGAKGAALPLGAPDGAHYVVHVLPLTADARRLAGTSYPATAALFIRKTEIESVAAPEVISQAYNLTPAELRVLLAIVQVGGVPEVAASLGVAETTVKTHLGRLFAKTGVSRQADLVKIVAGFSTPLAD